jgi:hypothetical protein
MLLGGLQELTDHRRGRWPDDDISEEAVAAAIALVDPRH